MEIKFEEKQTAVWILPLLIIGIVMALYAYFANPTDQMNSLAFLLVICTMILIGFLFYRLKTVVDGEKIEVSFGMGFIKKQIMLESIESVKEVRNKWYYGFGIRYYGKGWMWNIWGLDAVELTFFNKKSRFRIGTQQANKLMLQIESGLNKS